MCIIRKQKKREYIAPKSEFVIKEHDIRCIYYIFTLILNYLIKYNIIKIWYKVLN